MATTLEDIRFTMERAVQDTIDNQNVINWANDAQTEILMQIDIPASTTMAVNTNDVSYPLVVTNIRRINRLWLTEERNMGVDRDISIPYRIYSGNIVFAYRFSKADTLNIEYYRYLTHFADITDAIDLDDRFGTLYTSYGLAQYYDLPSTVQRVGEAQARRQYDKNYARHLMIKDQIASQFTLLTQPSTIKEAW